MNHLGIKGNTEVVDIIQSRLPSWVPLWIRELDNRRVEWHDLNISTNELSVLLSNKKLQDAFKEVAGENKSMYGALLWTAITMDPEASGRLRLFLAVRFYERTVPDLKHLSVAENQMYKKSIAIVYAISQSLKYHRELWQKEDFWNYFYTLISREYPFANYNVLKHNRNVKLKNILNLIFPPAEILFNSDENSFFTKKLAQQLVIIGDHFMRPNEKLSQEKLIKAIREYVVSNKDQFIFSQSINEMNGAEILPLYQSNADKEDYNFIWKTKLLRTKVKNEIAKLNESFELALKRSLSLPTHARSKRILNDAQAVLEKRFQNLLWQLKELEYQWLEKKYIAGPQEEESNIPNYGEFLKRLDNSERAFSKTINQLRSLNFLLLGFIQTRLEDPQVLRTDIEKILELNKKDSEKLGLNIIQRMCALFLM
jgi:hypothetical protein